MSPGVASPLPRVVPTEGASLAGRQVPGGVGSSESESKQWDWLTACRPWWR